MMVSTVGYPSRPTGGGELPRDFKLLSTEIATPKLDGHRVLYCCHTKEFYNRHCQKYTYMDDGDKARIRTLLSPIKYVDWVDMEYMHCGKNKGKFVIIDVTESGIRHRNYHERRQLYEQFYPHCSIRESFALCATHEWYDIERSHTIKDPLTAFVFPVARTTEAVVSMYKEMYASESAIMLMNDVMDSDRKGIWEGVVVKDASAPYKLQRKQSQNMDMEVKYRFK
jgi:hypothetical protein